MGNAHVCEGGKSKMWRGRPALSRSTTKCWVGLLGVMLVVTVASCGGQGAEEDGSALQPVVKAENAEVGKSIEGQGWRITLLDVPERMKMIGGEVAGVGTYVRLKGTQGFADDDITAEGVYVVAPIEITNISDEALYVSQSVLKVMDSDGQSYDAGGRIEHKVYVWITERWMKEEHELIPGVMDNGLTRQGPIIFDVPEDATGLALAIDGADDTIDLGF